MSNRLNVLLAGLATVGVALASNAPVGTATPGNNNVPAPKAPVTKAVSAKPFMTNGERIAHLEKQMKGLVAMNLPARITALQQQVQQLNGELQVQQHDLKLLQKQQSQFYKDLNTRITQVENLQSSNGDNGAATAKAVKVTAKKPVESVQLSESTSYSKAFSLLSKQQYTQAAAAFTKYVNDYPNGTYVPNAHYWLGEIYAVQNNNDAAIKEFQTVVKRYPKSSKVSDAELKLAMLELKQGNNDKAKALFTKIKKAYPGSAAAQLATMQLKQMALQADAIQ